MTPTQALEQPSYCRRCQKTTDTSISTYDPVLMRLHIEVRCHGEAYKRVISREVLVQDPKGALSFFTPIAD